MESLLLLKSKKRKQKISILRGFCFPEEFCNWLFKYVDQCTSIYRISHCCIVYCVVLSKVSGGGLKLLRFIESRDHLPCFKSARQDLLFPVVLGRTISA